MVLIAGRRPASIKYPPYMIRRTRTAGSDGLRPETKTVAAQHGGDAPIAARTRSRRRANRYLVAADALSRHPSPVNPRRLAGDRPHPWRPTQAGSSSGDRALLLIGFAGALRRSELCGIEVEHISWKPRSLELLIPRSKTDAEGEGARIGIPRVKPRRRVPSALQAWLDAAGIARGPVFRSVSRHGTLRSTALSGGAVRMIVLKRARLAGIRSTRLEPISPHGLTTAYRNGVPDEEIMGHSRHRSLTTMRSYVRRSKLMPVQPASSVCSHRRL